MGLTGTVSAFAGALGFLTRLPIGRGQADWVAFRSTPAALPVAGYVIGALIAAGMTPVAIGVPPPVAATALLAWVYVLTGVTHVDGLADLADGMVVHGDAERRLAAMADTTVGVGALVAVGVLLAGFALAGLALAEVVLRGRLLVAVGVVVAAEVGAKLGMATLVTIGSAAHEGMGAELADRVGPSALLLPAIVALPAVTSTWPSPAAAVALVVPVGTAIALLGWARSRLGGVTGDVLGAANELGRVAGLHAGVIAWTLS